MKLFVLTFNSDDGFAVSHHATEAEADAAFAEAVAMRWKRRMGEGAAMPADAAQAYEELCAQPLFLDTIDRAEFDLSEHPAVKEAVAALTVATERLSMNNIEGEELPFMHDCEVAIALLEGREPPEWDESDPESYDAAHGYEPPAASPETQATEA